MTKKDVGLLAGIVSMTAGSFALGLNLGKIQERKLNSERWKMLSIFFEASINNLKKKESDQENES